MLERVASLLKEKGLWIATAESCTGGLIGHKLTNIPGSSEYFKGGVISYGNEVKMKLLGVKEETLKKYGAVYAAFTGGAGALAAKSIKRLIIPSEMLGGMDLDPFIGAKNFNEFINLLAGTRYKAISKMDIENPLILESMFRWIYYQGVFNKVSKIPRDDKPDVMKILGIELDLHNIRVYMLPILYDYDRKLAENLLIDNPAGKSKRLLMELRSIEELLESFPRYRVFIEALMRREEWRAEIEHLRILKDEVDGKRISKYINFFYVLKYILDCEVEYRNLRSIAISLYHNLPVNIRRSLLILPRI